MTNMIQIDREKLVDAFARAIAEAEPAVSAMGMIDVRSIAGLAEKGRELAAAGAFRNKTIYSETVDRLDREGYSEAEVVTISEIGLQIGRAVNAAFMNAAGVYSSTAKLLRAFEKESEAVTEEHEALDVDVEPLIRDAENEANMKCEGFYWDDQSQSYVDIDCGRGGAEDLHPDVAAAIDRVTAKHKLVTTH
ncbi:hypothetical protein [Shinella sp. JR1-6]|uniref:hypothetical protein n=1 Tax=Shinella sp. JR1-6 TaxID=2527671 RepID=UPI00102D4D7A|nr:hypothetical protein [Shinella sp. JR1-6]TAA63116.1 hypothetical protein EXZ48_05230 [Shinella sp. JR1-6]